jgi:hypothetical protein
MDRLTGSTVNWPDDSEEEPSTNACLAENSSHPILFTGNN